MPSSLVRRLSSPVCLGMLAMLVAWGAQSVSAISAAQAPSLEVRYRYAHVEGLNLFYREAGKPDAPTLLLLHGFPTSSHMYRNLIPLLAEHYHVIAPDYPGFGFSDSPSPDEFSYTFDHLTSVMESFIESLKLGPFSLYVQDYGGPIGFRIASHHPEWIQALIIQNALAYTEGISPAFEAFQPFWEARNATTEAPVRALLTRETTKFQYTQGASDPAAISPDNWTFDQYFLDRPGNDVIQLDLFHDYPSNVVLFPTCQAYFRKSQPPTLIVWGENDPFFTVEGAKAFQKDLPQSKLKFYPTGHFALEEYGTDIAADILQFLEQHVQAD